MFLTGITNNAHANNPNPCGNPPKPVNNNNGPCGAGTTGPNPIEVRSGNVMRTVTDIRVWGVVGDIPLEFKRTSHSRYQKPQDYTSDEGYGNDLFTQSELNDPTDAAYHAFNLANYPLGISGSWQHNFHMPIFYAFSKNGQPRLRVFDSAGMSQIFERKSPTDIFLTSISDMPDRIQFNYKGDPTLYMLYKANGERYLIKFLGNDTYRVMAHMDKAGNGLNYIYETSPPYRLTQVINAQTGRFLSFQYGGVDLESGKIPIRFVLTQNSVNSVGSAVNLSTAKSVNLLGTFNNWTNNVMELEKVAPDRWEGTFLIPPGDHQYKFFINGHLWLADPFSNTSNNSNDNPSGNTKITVAPGNGLIKSVITSDGRQVKYRYNYICAQGKLYPTLIEVDYGYEFVDDGNGPVMKTIKAHYSYVSEVGHRPLLVAADDPRYEGKMKRVRYEYHRKGVEGFAKYEKTWDEKIVAEIMLPTNPTTVNQAEGWRGTQSPWGQGIYTYYVGSAQIASVTDVYGMTTSYTYEPGGGWLKTVTTPAGTTIYERTPHFGAIKKTTFTGTLNGVTYTRETQTVYTDDNFPFYPQKEIDPMGFQKQYFYEDTSDGRRLKKVIYPDGTYEEYTYHSSGQVATRRDRAGQIWTSEYHPTTKLKIKDIDPLGHVTTYTYHPSGLLESVTDPKGYKTTYSYNPRGKITSMIYHNATRRQFFYSSMGYMTAERNELNKEWRYTYDEFGRLKSKTDPLGRTTSYSYDYDAVPGSGGSTGCNCANYGDIPRLVTYPNGLKVYSIIEGEGRIKERIVGHESAQPATTKFFYNPQGWVAKVIDPNGNQTQYLYNAAGLKIREIDPLGRQTQFEYNARGDLVKITRPDGKVKTFDYDSLGRKVKEINENNEATTYTYTPLDAIHTITDAKGQVHTYSYNNAGRKSQLTFPDGTFEKWDYDEAGNVIKFTRRDGTQITYTYDNRHRLVLSDFSDTTPDETRTYDAAGRLIRVQSSVSDVHMAYNDAGEKTFESQQPIEGSHPAYRQFWYGYTPNGQVEWMVTPSSGVYAYGWTIKGELHYVYHVQEQTFLAIYDYDAGGRRVKRTMSNGTSTEYGYDAANQVTIINHKKGNASEYWEEYDYDVLGRRINTEYNGTSVRDLYQYDPIGQIKEVKYSTLDNANPQRIQTWD
ncbi:MAG: hypothetical protein NZM04_04960, partial [Methylacidiphilales bacterium]|nr:hypothetical protein [Candidatus Methylacidiphilales bacterium]